MHIVLCAVALSVAAAAAHAAQPGDAVRGERLHEAHCMRCHDTGVYTRQDHKVRSLKALQQQVVNCTHMAEGDFTAGERQDIVKYLNQQFYKFE